MVEQTVFADIPVEGTASPDDLISRSAIVDELERLGLGQFVGPGGGSDSIGFSYRVSDAASALSAIANVIKKHLPNREFSVDIS